MNISEQILYSIDLPQFLVNFKDKCLLYSIPFIDSGINYLENVDSPLIFLLLILILVQLLRTILMKTPFEAKQQTNNSENRQISKEVRDLKKQLKSIQAMLTQLKSMNMEGGSKVAVSNQGTSKLIDLCKEAWQKREKIASEIIDEQLKIIKQVTKLKNKTRSSRSPSRHQATGSHQLSAQSKKSVNSMILPPENKDNQPSKHLFTSQIKQKDSVIDSAGEVNRPTSVYVQQAVINVKFENQPKNGRNMPSIDISVHEFKKEKENTVIQTYQSVSINNPISFVREQKIQQNNESQETIIPQVIKVAPSLPRPPLNLPRPPMSNKKDTKKAPPPPFKPPTAQ